MKLYLGFSSYHIFRQFILPLSYVVVNLIISCMAGAGGGSRGVVLEECKIVLWISKLFSKNEKQRFSP